MFAVASNVMLGIFIETIWQQLMLFILEYVKTYTYTV